MNHNFVINDFEGPLDLLLHLIKQSKMDIYDIQIEEITKQYLDFIKSMEEINLNIASEYLVMASELIELKSKLLLPNNNLDAEDEYEENTKENLINRLLEYKKYKDMVSTFKDMESDRKKIFTKGPMNLKEFSNNEVINNGSISLEDLMYALNNFLKRKELEKPISTKITKKEISVSHRINEVRNILKLKKKVSFFSLFKIKNREYVVVTFLSILEMAKNDEIDILQENNFKEIIVKLRGENYA